VKLSPARASGPAVATFVPQNRTKSGSTNLPDGVVHVYRDAEQQKLAETDEGTSAPDASRVMLENADSDGYMVGVLAVPSWMTPSDFLAFVAPAQEDMSHLRMVRCVSCRLQPSSLFAYKHVLFRDTAPNRSIALIKFRKVESALEFAEAYNGKSFNSMNVSTSLPPIISDPQHLTVHRQPETCHVVHIRP
jgi:BRCA1-associated protein